MKKRIILVILVAWLGVHITKSFIGTPESTVKKKGILKRIVHDLQETEFRLKNWGKKTKEASPFMKPLFIAQVKALSETKKALILIKNRLQQDIKRTESSIT